MRVAYDPWRQRVEAVGQAANGAGLLWFDGASWHALGVTCFGQTGCAIGWDGESLVRYSQLSGTQYWRDDQIFAMPSTLPQGTSQGWLDVFPAVNPVDDVLRWTDLYRVTQHGALTLVLAVERDGVWLGQSVTPEGILGYQDAIAAPFQMLLGQAFPPHIATDGTRWAGAVPVNHVGAVFQVFPPFPPITAAPEPPVSVPVLPELPRKLHLYTFKQNCSVGMSNDARFDSDVREVPWDEDALGNVVPGLQRRTIGPVEATYHDERHYIYPTFPYDYRRAVFVSAEAGQAFDQEQWDRSVRLAYQSGRALIANMDGRNWRDSGDELDRLFARVTELTGLPATSVVIPSIECYPRGDMGGNQLLHEWASDACFLVERYGFERLAVVAPFYQQKNGAGVPNWPLQHVVDLHPFIHELCSTYHEVVAVGLFPYHRENDGIANSPTMAALAEAWLVANDVAGEPDELAILETVPPVEPPTPQPPNPGEPPMETAEQKRERMTAILAIGGGFCPDLTTYQERYRQTVIEVEDMPDYTEADVIKHHIERKGFLYK